MHERIATHHHLENDELELDTPRPYQPQRLADYDLSPGRLSIMQPTSFNLRGQARDGFESRGAQQAQDAPGVIRALSGARRSRSDGMYHLQRRTRLQNLSFFPFKLQEHCIRGVATLQRWIILAHSITTQNRGSRSRHNLLRHPYRQQRTR